MRLDQQTRTRLSPPAAADPAEATPDVVAGAVRPPMLSGDIAATMLAAGVGCALLGLLVVLSEASERAAALLTLQEAVGPLSGKAVAAVTGWLLAWALLHVLLRSRSMRSSRCAIASLVLVGMGFLLTFPPVYVFLAGGH